MQHYAKSGLDHHVDSIHKKITFKCDSCKESFKTKQYLKLHIRYVHEKVREFKCHLCEYESARKDDLKVHVSGVHQKISPFKCDFCERSFIFKHKLSIHMRAIHFGEKDKCKWCNKLFSPTHILDHQKKCNYNENFNSKKLRCNICNSDKLYASEKSLKVHQKLQHSETKKMYPCNLCEKSFATEYKAKKHIKDVHIEKSEFVHCKKCDKLMKPFSLPLHVKKCRGQKSKSEKAKCESCNSILSLDHLKRGHPKYCASKRN